MRFYNATFFLRSLRDDVNGCIERARVAKEVGSSQECEVFLHTNDPAKLDLLTKMKGDSNFLDKASTNEVDDLRFLLLVSRITITQSIDELLNICPNYHINSESSKSGLSVGVKTASGHKCERCWYYSDTVVPVVNDVHNHSDLCPRCTSVVNKINQS